MRCFFFLVITRSSVIVTNIITVQKRKKKYGLVELTKIFVTLFQYMISSVFGSEENLPAGAKKGLHAFYDYWFFSPSSKMDSTIVWQYSSVSVESLKVFVRLTLRKKYPYPEFFWLVFSRIQTEMLRVSLLSLNTGKYGPEKFRIRTLFTKYKVNIRS